MTIADKTILITGANRGIGRALVEEALARGAKRVYAGTRGGAVDINSSRVTPLPLDVTDAVQIQRAVQQIGTLDVLVNNAGVALYDNLTDQDTIQKHLSVNFFGLLNVTRAFLPLLKRSRGAIVNSLSLAAIAPLPMISGYSISKAAALNATQAMRALLTGQGVSVHAAILGPIDTDMTRGFEIPKSSPAAAAKGILDGLDAGEEEIFPDPAAQQIAAGWRAGMSKALERQFVAFVPPNMLW